MNKVSYNHVRDFAVVFTNYIKTIPILGGQEQQHRQFRDTLIEYLKLYDPDAIEFLNKIRDSNSTAGVNTIVSNFQNKISSKFLANNQKIQQLIFEITIFLRSTQLVASQNLLKMDEHKLVVNEFISKIRPQIEKSDFHYLKQSFQLLLQLKNLFNSDEALSNQVNWSHNTLLLLTRDLDSSTSQQIDDGLLKIIFSKFHKFASLLNNRYNNRRGIEVNDEYDVQDLVNALLNIHYQDVRKEEYTPSYGGGSSRIDFLLKEDQIGIEIKKTRSGLRDKEIGDQLIIDIDRYQKSHPDCKKLVCFVYDPENYIVNPVALERDLSRNSEVFGVSVYIYPKL